MSLSLGSFISFLILLSFHLSIIVASSSFSFVQITDIHIGDSKGRATIYLNAIVDYINHLHATQPDKYNLRSVYLTGDLTNTALPWEFQTIQTVMDKLNSTLQWLPLMGNHDCWTYNSTWEEPFPTGDAIFQRLFGNHIANDKTVKFYSGNSLVPNPEHNIQSFFHNFVVDSGVHSEPIFVALDWNSRAKAAPTYKGSWPGAEMHDFANGTYQWFQSIMPFLEEQNRPVIMLQHHPFRTPTFVPTDIYGWRSKDKNRLRTEVLEKQSFPIPEVFAGHFHRWWDGTAYDTYHKTPDLMQHESPASKDDGLFAIVSIDETGMIGSVEEFHAGPA
mmetsp:Transcript_3326/g.12634  ORF Transcript_3326/g.12634 Transcript_3326/m.12634 type:complete len:332 (+) Transcript_3326:2723-3718(+)